MFILALALVGFFWLQGPIIIMTRFVVRPIVLKAVAAIYPFWHGMNQRLKENSIHGVLYYVYCTNLKGIVLLENERKFGRRHRPNPKLHFSNGARLHTLMQQLYFDLCVPNQLSFAVCYFLLLISPIFRALKK